MKCLLSMYSTSRLCTEMLRSPQNYHGRVLIFKDDSLNVKTLGKSKKLSSSDQMFIMSVNILDLSKNCPSSEHGDAGIEGLFQRR